MCSSHYQRWYKSGGLDLIASGNNLNTLAGGRQKRSRPVGGRRPRSRRPCSVLDCEHRHYAHGLCRLHWSRWRRTGSVEAVSRSAASSTARSRAARRHSPRSGALGRPPQLIGDVEAFITSLRKDVNGCMLWPRATTHNGYGRVTIGRITYRAHRLSLAMKLGRQIAEGMFVCHTCDVPSCVNPDHLWEGTHDENMEDMVLKGRSPGPKQAKQIQAKAAFQP